MALSARAYMFALSNVIPKDSVTVLALPSTLAAFSLVQPALTRRAEHLLAVRAGAMRFTVAFMLRSSVGTTQNLAAKRTSAL